MKCSSNLPGAPCSAPTAPAASAHLPRSRGGFGGAHTLDRTTQTPAPVGLSNRGIPGSRLRLPTLQRCKFRDLGKADPDCASLAECGSASPVPPRLQGAGY